MRILLSQLATVLLALVFTRAPAFADPPNPTLLFFDNGPLWHLGDGVDQVTGEQHAACLNQEHETPDDRALAQTIDINYLNTIADLRQSLELSAYAAAFGIGASFSFNLDDVVGHETREERSNLYLRVRVTGADRRWVELDPSGTALKLISADPTGRLFAQSCGDAAVTDIEDGAELFAVITINSSSKSETDSLFLAMRAASAGAGELDAGMKKQLVDFSKSFQTTIHIVQSGLGGISVPSFTDLAQLMEYARTFTSKIKSTGESRPLMTCH